MSKDKIQVIDDLILNTDLCVLATSDGIAPWTSLMTYFVDHAVKKFYFLSRTDSQKSRNIKKNPHVSLLIDRRDENIALNVQGVYSPIRKEQTAEAIIKLFLIKHPQLKAFAESPDTELFRIEAKSGQLAMGTEGTFSTKFKNS